MLVKTMKAILNVDESIAHLPPEVHEAIPHLNHPYSIEQIYTINQMMTMKKTTNIQINQAHHLG